MGREATTWPPEETAAEDWNSALVAEYESISLLRRLLFYLIIEPVTNLCPPPPPPPVYMMQNICWLLHFNFSERVPLIIHVHICFLYIYIYKQRDAEWRLCCAFAFFYLIKNIILNNIYNDNKEKCIGFKKTKKNMDFFVFYF